MLSKHETLVIMEDFFRDCLGFWRRNVDDEREAFKRALDDVSHITTNPFSPYGDTLDTEAKKKYLKNKEMDLGMRG